MVRSIWIAYEESPQGRWALKIGAALSDSAVKLTLHQSVPAADEPIGDEEALELEILDLDEARRLRRLERAAIAAADSADTAVRLSVGDPIAELLTLLRWERPDIVVAGASSSGSWSRGLLRPELGRALLRRAPCPILIVREHPPCKCDPVIVVCGDGHGRPDSALDALGEAAAGSRLVHIRAPIGVRDGVGIERLVRACHRYRPWLVAVGREWWPAFRAALGRSSAEAVVAASACPVLVVPRRRGHEQAAEATPSPGPVDEGFHPWRSGFIP